MSMSVLTSNALAQAFQATQRAPATEYKKVPSEGGISSAKTLANDVYASLYNLLKSLLEKLHGLIGLSKAEYVQQDIELEVIKKTPIKTDLVIAFNHLQELVDTVTICQKERALHDFEYVPATGSYELAAVA